MFAFGWLRVGSFSGCICTRVDFLGCNCAWNMRVDFVLLRGRGLTSMFAFGWLRVGSFGGCICTRVDLLAATVPGI